MLQSGIAHLSPWAEVLAERDRSWIARTLAASLAFSRGHYAHPGRGDLPTQGQWRIARGDLKGRYSTS